MFQNGKPPLPSKPDSEDWRALAERASKETDPKKMLELVQRLCDALEQCKAERKPQEIPRRPPSAPGD
jgi:hypothetical protein